jgi:tetratricopeptide (TPR) repeat protein
MGMFELKPLSREAVGRALEKAERYRLLNEPGEAESICLDVLAVEPENQQALVTLLLARTDEFEERTGEVARAQEVVARLEGHYERAYYAGIIYERKAKAQLKRGGAGMGAVAQGGFRQAMRLYEKAEDLRPPGNDDALLRWNACARVLERLPRVESPQEEYEAPLE